ncbi:MAG: 23S rRNA (uracil(1939)-C(5))-methyltransferase RlmD [Anaerovoracaceae bacterium]|nr:23S rRNA (uracil(1939)-C(5))-methyltransferase RlmD [Anaerovoracaceae bacterium]
MANTMEVCKHNDFCGGCLHQGMPYADQLAWKQEEFEKAMREASVTCPDVRPIQGSPQIYRYRNKMEYTFGDLEKGGEMTLGMHRKKRYMSVMTVDECQLVDEDFNRILRATLEFCIEKGYPKYHKKLHAGLMRHLVIRKGFRTRELLVNIMTTSESRFDEDGYVGALMRLDLDNEIVGIIHTVNDNIADKADRDESRVIYGRDYYNETVLGLRFRVSAFSFFQTNVEAAERMYSDALGLLDDYGGLEVMDLYCGTGTITQMLALRAGHVTGVEIVDDAVRSAMQNARANGLSNCDFIAGDVLEILRGAKEGTYDVPRPDVIAVDPPRVGIHRKALDLIAAYGVNQILYISCQPKSLCRDIKYLEAFGYRPVYMKPYDNFPFTRHIETVVLMVNKNTAPKDYVKIGLDAEDHHRIVKTGKQQDD